MTVATITQPLALPANRVELAQLVKQAALLLTFAGIVLLAFDRGVYLRQWLYLNETSYYARFRSDIANAWMQGSNIVGQARAMAPDEKDVPLRDLLAAYRGQYGRVSRGLATGVYPLDYPPGRLLVISLWTWWAQNAGKTSSPWDYDVAWPLLATNTTLESLGALAAFLLARHVLRRQSIRGAEFLALLPALLLWFNPAVLMDAHVWPQWDAWLIPFYLLACWFGLSRRWLVVGACVTLGGMLKGQMLIVMGVFVLWPLFQWRLRAVLEVIAGTMLTALALMSPWMIRSPTAVCVLAGCAILILVGLPGVRRGWRVLFAVTALPLVILHIGLYLDGDLSWWRIGFAYGTRAHQHMHAGPTPNLAALLAVRFGWQLNSTVFTPNLPWLGLTEPVVLRTFLGLLYGAALLLCGIGAAIQDRRNDRRVLAALALPWAMMFALLPQMHDRYFVWGAAITAMLAAVSLGSTLLHFVVTMLACFPIFMNTFGALPQDAALAQPWLPLLRFAQASFPDAAWATLLACAVLLYLALTPARPGDPARPGP